MSTNYIHIGSINNNNSRNLTINGNPSNRSDVINSFFHDRNTEDIQAEEVTPEAETAGLFKYIHPSVVEDKDRLKVHREVCNLVRNFPIADICKHLQQMRREKLVYLSIKPEAMFDELHRLGMPDEQTQGFSYKNFMHHFNIN